MQLEAKIALIILKINHPCSNICVCSFLIFFPFNSNNFVSSNLMTSFRNSWKMEKKKSFMIFWSSRLIDFEIAELWSSSMWWTLKLIRKLDCSVFQRKLIQANRISSRPHRLDDFFCSEWIDVIIKIKKTFSTYINKHKHKAVNDISGNFNGSHHNIAKVIW